MIDKTAMIPGVGAVGGAAGAKTNAKTAGTGFAELVKQASESDFKQSQSAETLSIKSVTKEAEIVDVVTAVASAQMTLETVMAVRDKVIAAYQDIIKMPI